MKRKTNMIILYSKIYGQRKNVLFRKIIQQPQQDSFQYAKNIQNWKKKLQITKRQFKKMIRNLGIAKVT
ncbi:hypothetical protein FGO68_gene1521 [Halteria grandinella]|uniref:Uncharacterized protein n=1 Tax=Halteria grandinella TaxID=5974 RepID=A0A8J8SX83_HALGN|nr:hypothetical protein FGO68_gene1521 [Halteria grandinella]